MGCITGLLLIISVGALLAFDILFWTVSWIYGLIGILALIAFLIAYGMAEEFSLSPRDFIRNSEWGIFCKKIGWAWGVALMVYAGAIVLSVFISTW